MSKEKISDYLENYNKINLRGTCKVCSALVSWSWERVKSHKRSKCTSEADRLKFTKQKVLETSKNDESLQAPGDVDTDRENEKLDNFEISKYLENFNRETTRGQCKSCSVLVSWTRDRVASHKRTNCSNISNEEREYFARKKPRINPKKEKTVLNKSKSSTGEAENQLRLEFESTSYFSNFTNHKNRCRLCISDTGLHSERFMITEEIQALILEVQIELTFTKNFSDFICSSCHQNLLQISYFRQQINEKQHQLSVFLRTVKHERDDEQIEYPNSSAWYDSYDQIQNIKAEPEDPAESIVVKTEIFDDETESFNENFHVPEVNYSEPDFKDPKYYKPCPDCGKIIKKQYLSIHKLRNHTKPDRFVCDFCGKGFVEKGNFMAHVRMHIPLDVREKFYCPFCLESYYSMDGLRQHKKKHHPNEIQKIPKTSSTSDQNPNPDIPCHLCGKIVKKTSIFGHLSHVHRKNFKYTCDFCGKGCYERRQIETHVRTHIPVEFRESFYECLKCQKHFYTPDGLRTHEKKHHDEYTNKAVPVSIEGFSINDEKKTFLCSDCGKICDKLCDLKRHVLIHQEKSISCDFPGCTEKFRVKYQLKRHKDFIHFGIRKFVCNFEECGKNFMTASRLRRHIKTMHECKTKCPVDGCKYRTSIIGYMKHHLKNRHLELEREYQQMLLENIKNMNLVW